MEPRASYRTFRSAELPHPARPESQPYRSPFLATHWHVPELVENPPVRVTRVDRDRIDQTISWAIPAAVITHSVLRKVRSFGAANSSLGGHLLLTRSDNASVFFCATARDQIQQRKPAFVPTDRRSTEFPGQGIDEIKVRCFGATSQSRQNGKTSPSKSPAASHSRDP